LTFECSKNFKKSHEKIVIFFFISPNCKQCVYTAETIAGADL
jgi:hypothetical protein